LFTRYQQRDAGGRDLALIPRSPHQLAAIDPGPPYASNGTALKLAALANPECGR
jgi:hypothetical protein